MLPVASLLNPINSEPQSPQIFTSACSSPYNSTSSAYRSPLLSSQSIITKQKMTKDGAVFSKGKIKGEVNFPPFEKLEQDALQEVQRYNVYPLGKIESYCRHIPYNSEKKGFLEKTGRESFEVFQYEFKIPGEDKIYTVMWDYNVGLVRMTPFFKCCKYSKTTPAKMLNLNPGLKGITHSITGGALAAQGYWMPFSCALAVCATFCDHISGALIPIFGPTFPSRCTPVSSPSYARMIIDPSIIATAAEEASSFREYYTSTSTSTFSTPSPVTFDHFSPQNRFRDVGQRSFRGTPLPLGKRLRVKRTFINDNQHDSDPDLSDLSLNNSDRYLYSPISTASTASIHEHGLNTQNTQYLTSTPRTIHATGFDGAIIPYKSAISSGASPWLSAIPRSIDKQPCAGNTAWQTSSKRKAAEVDEGYEGEESASESVRSKESEKGEEEGGMEKKAAWLLMKLSERDRERGATSTLQANIASSKQAPKDIAVQEWNSGPQGAKRRRATSM